MLVLLLFVFHYFTPALQSISSNSFLLNCIHGYFKSVWVILHLLCMVSCIMSCVFIHSYDAFRETLQYNKTFGWSCINNIMCCRFVCNQVLWSLIGCQQHFVPWHLWRVHSQKGESDTTTQVFLCGGLWPASVFSILPPRSRTAADRQGKKANSGSL